VRTGKSYLESLNDDRNIIVDGQSVSNVAEHPGFRGIAESVAQLYDHARDEPKSMQFDCDAIGGAANATFMTPRSRDDLRLRREAISRWARMNNGFVGRSPDHVASFFAGFASAPQLFDTDDRAFGANVVAYYERILAESLYVSYVIIPPQVDRSTTAHDWDGSFIQAGIVAERDDGIIVRGSQMLGTGSAVCDEVFVSCIKPLTPGDEQYAISFAVPMSTPGLRVYCRRPYAIGQPSRFDYPLSTRFDETDGLVVFDDVFVPWERVFVVEDLQRVRSQFFDTAAHVLGNSQAQIRFVEKTKFIAGVARKIAEVNGIDKMPPVQEKLGELASLASVVEGMVIASEATSAPDAYGVERPNPRFLYGVMGLQAELYPRIMQIVRDLAGAGVIQLPSSFHDLVDPETAPDIARYIQSPGYAAEERVKLFKLAWDTVGSEFAGRHQQYEMFYAGAPFVAKGYAFRNYGFGEAVDRVTQFLQSYSLDDAALENDLA
jgi:4-hydroxyphenylacetate 3-monooxygenase